jgi:O-antigen/teichoic acid export membrane protein
MTDEQPAYQLFGQMARMFAAEALLVPVGILTAAFLSRRFGPAGYGLLALSGVVVVWVEANVGAALSSPAIKLVGDAKDWRPAGAVIVRLYLVVGFALMLLLWATAAPLARMFGEPALTGYLLLFALDVPLFCLAQAHRTIIIGLGRFRERALATAARWTTRLVLVVVFVELSGALSGAIWGIISASLIELCVCRLYVRPRLFQSDARSMRRLCVDALPLVASALCMSLYSRLDLILLKALGATPAEAGYYGVAQNVSLLLTLFSFAFAPALLSTLARALRDGDVTRARQLCRQSLRAVLFLLPLAAALAGAASEVVVLVFGTAFLPATPLLRLLVFGAWSLLMLSAMTSMIIARGKTRWTFHVAWPLLLCAVVGHLWLIPRAGAQAAAAVTACLASAGVVVTLELVRRLWRVSPPAATLCRSILISATVYALNAYVPASGLLLFIKLASAGVFTVAAFLMLGEFGRDEIDAARAMLRRAPQRRIETPSRVS